MRVAADPVTGKRITPKQYLEKYVEPFEAHSVVGDCPPARCPICGNGMQITLNSRSKWGMGFSHFPNNFPCPLRMDDRRGYRISPGRGGPPQHAAVLRAAFFANWKRHWHEFKKHVGHADITDFIGLLKYADGNGIWRFRGLKESDAVILLLLINDFKPEISNNNRILRKHWVRFWFVAPTYNMDEFLFLPEPDRICIKTLYSLSGSSLTLNIQNLDSFEVLKIEGDHSTSPEVPAVHDYIEQRMLRAFSRDLYA